jgi:hypothetical protein
MSNKPSNFDLIKEAILALKDRTGSSPAAIKTYLAKQHPTITLDHQFSRALKNGVSAGTLIKVRRRRRRRYEEAEAEDVRREEAGREKKKEGASRACGRTGLDCVSLLARVWHI